MLEQITDQATEQEDLTQFFEPAEHYTLSELKVKTGWQTAAIVVAAEHLVLEGVLEQGFVNQDDEWNGEFPVAVAYRLPALSPEDCDQIYRYGY